MRARSGGRGALLVALLGLLFYLGHFVPGSSHAQPKVEIEPPRIFLRLATAAPQGSAWARELASTQQEIDRGTKGRVKVKIFFGGAAGDEVQEGERIEKGQLDGAVSGGMLCRHLMPSMAVTGLLGTFQSRDEASHVIAELRPTIDGEAQKAGYVLLGTAGLGSDIVFSRQPIESMEQLRKVKLWRWDLAGLELLMSKEMGMSPVPLSIVDAAKAYDEGRTDGFSAVPQAALAFQWYAQTGYITDLRMGYLTGCVVVSTKAFEQLTAEDQQVAREAFQRFALRVEDTGHQQDDQLLGGVFQKQGLKLVPVSEKFRAEFFEAARAARVKLGDKLVPKALEDRVMQLLADYRAEHGGRGK